MRRWSGASLCVMMSVLAAGLVIWSGRTGAQELEPPPAPASVHPPASASSPPSLTLPGPVEAEVKKDPAVVPEAEVKEDPPPPPAENKSATPAPPRSVPPALKSELPALETPARTSPTAVPSLAPPPAAPSTAPAAAEARTNPIPTRSPALMTVTAPEQAASPSLPRDPPAFRLLNPRRPEPGPFPSAPVSTGDRVAATTKPLGTTTAPAVSLEKIVPATVTAGTPFHYDLLVRNLGSAPAFQVRLEDQLPVQAAFLGAEPKPERQGDHLRWDLGRLEAGAERRLKVEIRPAHAEEVVPAATVSFSTSSGQRLQSGPALPVTLKTTCPESAAVGEQIVVQIEVISTASVPATGLVLRVHLSPGLHHTQGSDIEADLPALVPGEPRKLSLKVVAAMAGPQLIESMVLGAGGAQTTAHAAIRVIEAGVRIQQTGPQRGLLDREIDYRIKVSNPGPADAAGLQINDVLPAGLEFVAAADGGVYEPASRSVHWQMPALPAGQVRQVSLKVLARAPGDLVNRVTARTGQGAEVHSEAVVQVGGLAALLLEINTKDNPVEVGVETVYDIRVVNRGNSAGTGAQVLASVPDGMEIRQVEGPTAFRVQRQQVIFAPLARLDPGADSHFRVRVRCLSVGDWRFRAQLTSDQLRLPLCKEESIRVYNDRN